jgi:hypothetical protein
MKKLILFLLSIACGGIIQSKAQSTPLYVCQPPDPMDILPTNCSGAFYTQSNPPLRVVRQYCYYKINFLNMSNFTLGLPNSGTITDLYLKMKPQMKGSLIKDLTIKINDTTLCGFTMGQSLIRSGLTTVFYDSLYTLTDSLADGDWWRIPLQTPFHYTFSTHPDSCKSLLIELYGLAVKPDDFDKGSFFDMYCYSNYINPMCILEVDTVKQFYSGNYFLPLIGFNPLPDPVGVKEVSNMRLTLYPNPASQLINLNHQGSYTISTLQGSVVQQGEGDAADIGNLPQGLYMVQLTTKNGERLVGRFLKE